MIDDKIITLQKKSLMHYLNRTTIKQGYEMHHLAEFSSFHFDLDVN